MSFVFYAQLTADLTFTQLNKRVRFTGNAGGLMTPFGKIAGVGAWFSKSPDELARLGEVEFHVLQAPGVVQVGWAKGGVPVGSLVGGGLTGLGAGGGLGSFSLLT